MRNGNEERKEPIQFGPGMTRRKFLEAAGATILFAGIGLPAWAYRTESGIPYRALGRTGEKVSLVGIGGSHIGSQTRDKESIEIIRTALDSGINFLDNSWDYHKGESEIRMGKALQDGYREKAFLMTKIDGRTGESAARQLDESLKRLQTDHVDLLQFHEIIRMKDPDRIFAAGGALEAVLAAKKAGKVRFIGFTGHKDPDIHLKTLEMASRNGFRFDAVQMPLNLMDAHYHSFEKKVLPVLVKEEIGVLGMKPMGEGHILDAKLVSATECLHYAMNLPTSVVITGCDSLPILRQAIDAARSFKPMDPAIVATYLAKTERSAKNGTFELYKTTHTYDSTHHNPKWLG
jgi:predicted aldo/keto reductase-like oxidoreductase